MSLDNLDRDLLAAARAAGERFAAAECETDKARTEYHQAVRRLHLAGASLRDVAHALGVSHQRVQQIVQANGGTWWSSVWRGRRVTLDMACSFCGLPDAQVAKLIAGPKVYICDACVGAAGQVFGGHTPKESSRDARMELLPVSSRVRCSFCGKKTGQTKTKSSPGLRVVQSGSKRVCDRCLDICRRILDDRSHAA
jgi:hypothetical protein